MRPNPKVHLLAIYASDDKDAWTALQSHLSSLRAQGLVSDWSVAQLLGGEDIEHTATAQVKQADLVLVLLSASFLASASCQTLLAQVQAEWTRRPLRLVPVLVRPVDWQGSGVQGLQPLPRNGVPVRLWPNEDAAWLDVVEALRQLLGAPAPSALAPAAQGAPPHEARRVQTPRRPWTLPPPSPYFTGRDEELQALRTALQTRRRASVGQVQAASGLGGIGKTQLALCYAQRHRGDYEVGFFLRADSAIALQSGLEAIGRALGLVSEDDDADAVQTAVYGWLGTHERWLIVADNAEELALLRRLCQTGAGDVIVTTRATDCTPLGVSNPVELEGLSPAQARTFLQERTGHAASTSEAQAALDAIVEEMQGLPLALEQAGAYIAARKMDFPGYLAAYRSRRSALLRAQPVHGDYPASVATTWSLNVEQVRAAEHGAEQLLRQMALLAPDAIPEELLAALLDEQEGPGRPLDDLLAPLLRYSLVRREPASRTLSLHRLLQAVIQETWAQEPQRQQATRLREIVLRLLPEARFVGWDLCERLLPQAVFLAASAEDLLVGAVLHRIADYLYDRARFKEAELLYLRSLVIREKTLGPDHPDVAATCNNLALLYTDQGKYTEAKPLYLRSLAIREKALGPDHPDVAATCSNLAGLYRAQGKYAEVEPLYLRSLALREKALGPDHPDVAATCSNLAGLYRAQGKYAEVEPLYLRSLAIYEKALGLDHPSVATTCNNLALLYNNQGKHAEAEPLYLRSLAITEKALGPDHPHVATTCNNLAGLCYAEGKYAEAEPLYLRSLAITEKALGSEHSDVAMTCNNLAGLYQAQSKYAEAEPLCLRSLAIYEKVLGPDHPFVGTTCSNLAGLYATQGKYAEAEPLYLRSLAITEKALGSEHPSVATTCNNLAGLYQAQSKYAEAEPLYLRSLANFEKALGPDHPDVAATCNNLALLYTDQGKYTEAEPVCLRSLAIFEKALGPDHPSVETSRASLAMLYQAQGKCAEAEALYLRSLANFEKALGPDHPSVATIRTSLAVLYAAQGKYAEAERLCLRSLAIYEKALGPDHPFVATTCNNLAGLYEAQGKYVEAEPLYLRDLAICEKALGPDHPSVATTCNNLAGLYDAQGKYAEAEALYVRSLAIKEKALGPDHPDVAVIRANLARFYRDRSH